MRLPESRIFALTALCCAALMTGCASDSDPAPAAAKSFNTLNILYTENDPGNNAFPSNEIYYYVDNPNARANNSTVLLAEYDKGQNLVLTLDTDLDLQGYEYSLFASEGQVYLLDYDKDRNNTPRAIIETGGEICAIHPMRVISERSTEEATNLEPIYRDLPGFFIEVNSTAGCVDQNNVVYKVQFSLEGDAEDSASFVAVDYSYIQGGHVVDFGSGGTNIQGEKQDLRTTFLGYNHHNNLLVSYDSDFNPVWSASFPSPASTFEVTQASRNLVALQADDALYVLTINEIFSAGPSETPGDQSAEIPPARAIAALLTTPSEDLDSAMLLGDKIVKGLDYFLIIDGFNLRQINTATRKFDPVSISQPLGLTDISATLRNDDKVLFIVKTTGSGQQLSYIDLDGGSESASILSATRIETFVTLEETYANSYDSTNDRYDAHWIDNNLIHIQFTNSQLARASDLRIHEPVLYILGSETSPTTNGLIQPSLYEFDPEQSDGRKRQTVDGVYDTVALGTLSSDVDAINAFTILNDEYALLSTRDRAGDSANYFVHPDDTDALQRMTLINSPTKADTHD